MDRSALVGAGSSLGHRRAVFLSLGLLLVVFFVYDAMWKALAKAETAGVAVSFVLVAVLIYALYQVFVPRAAAIHLGAAFATIMAMNVWMRIWPAQRKIIAAVQAGTAPDAALVGRAGLRSKHNTYMSVPLVLAMVNQHHLTILAGQPGFPGWAALTTMVAVGWVVVKLLYMKSAGPTPAKF